MEAGQEPARQFHDALLLAVPHIRARAFLLCRNQSQADDLTQEVLLRAWEKQDDLRKAASLVSWLTTILRNVYFAGRRRQKFEAPTPIELLPEAAAMPSQELTCEVRETLAAIEALAPELREVVILICLDDLSLGEVAEICSCPVGTVKSRLHRARAQLKERLDLTRLGSYEAHVATVTPQREPAAAAA